MRKTRIRDSYGRQRKNSAVALFLASCAALTVTSCSGGGSSEAGAKPTDASTKPAPSKSVDPEAATKQEVLARYNKYWAEQVKAFSKGSEKGTDLQKYATLDALGRARADLLNMKAAGNAMKGSPKHDAKVTALGLSKKTPDATITDCLDIRSWQTINRKTGKVLKLSHGNLTRYVTVVSAEKWPNGWMITKAEPKGQKC
ncbi:hypothetical protein [Streptomyces sp. NPDC048248]|uniref:hypothetical protein n=1 Tax=Streptomyces sp. NPDC048248 TaxID=3365523 RepID=UPI003713E908